MSNEFSMKELYDVFLKATYPIEIAGRTFEKNETICVFDKIQLSNFNEIKNRTTAHGGFADRDRVFWEDTKGIDLAFSQGIFNSLQFGLLSNSRLLYLKKEENLLVSKREEKETDEDGKVSFSYPPIGDFFVYDKKTGLKIDYEKVSDTEINARTPFMEVILDYSYAYTGKTEQITVGKRMIEGFLRLEAKTRVKDDISGKVRTGILTIPKLKLMSDLSMRLGKNANPVLANFKAVAVPEGERNDITVMNIFFLDDDIDSDM